jgi:hypothetical protein
MIAQSSANTTPVDFASEGLAAGNAVPRPIQAERDLERKPDPIKR